METAIVPVIVAAVLALFGWLLSNLVNSIRDDIRDLDGTFTRTTAMLARDHEQLDQKIVIIDRRLTRVESWKDLVSLTNRDYHTDDGE